ncbi:MAG: hypothetical protein ACLRFI_03350 [Alphaproteobacteria bacterium]
MNNTLLQSIPEKFHNAEQMWFWFIYSKSIQSNFIKKHSTENYRICELLDVERLITKLYLSGKLTDEQLSVMKEFGDKRRTPHQYIWKENRAAYQWKIAMAVLDVAARQKGWIE